MKLFETLDHSQKIADLISQQVVGDYVYMYPPRQAYHALDRERAFSLAATSLERSADLNLYFHVPFCKQICSFCNLYTTVLKKNTDLAGYVDLMIRETEMYRPHITDKQVHTLYLGGGTPSLLEPGDFERLFDYLKQAGIADLANIAEVALEAAPDTVDLDKFREFRSIGINRVNLGFQATSSDELLGIGRRHDNSIFDDKYRIVKEVGFSNVCIDLIYGLRYQTMESWRESLRAVIAYQPETICIYPLTLRDATSYSKKGYTHIEGKSQYRKYDYGVEALLMAGYRQETHIRFIKDNGGYIQKANHWRLENILGIGAGARSYLWDCDTRNNYGALTRDKALRHYVDAVSQGRVPITDGYVMSLGERMRKAVILNLINLDRAWFFDLFGEDVLNVFPLIEEMEQEGWLHISDRFISLNSQGLKYRDLIVQSFFSPEVINAIQAYDYQD